jgi:hypothetical protein
MKFERLDDLFDVDGRIRRPTEDELVKHDADTRLHIEQVATLLNVIINALRQRAIDHDRSKFEEPERSAYAVVIPKLAGLEYGSEEHRKVLGIMKPAIRHHQQSNRHHPEYHHSVAGMNLVDVVEMAADWRAATMRSGGDFDKSLKVSLKRFGIDDQLASIIINTSKLFEK